MLLQTNSYVVPKERRADHARLIRRFRQALAKIGCDQFDVYEQIGANWNPAGANGRYVQLMRFRDYQHQQAVQEAEHQDLAAQEIIAEFCALINFPYQQQHGYFTTGFYSSVLPMGPRLLEQQEPDVLPDTVSSTQPAAEQDALEHAAPPTTYVTPTSAPPAFGESENPVALAARASMERIQPAAESVMANVPVEPLHAEPASEEQVQELEWTDERPALDAFGVDEESIAVERPSSPQPFAIDPAQLGPADFALPETDQPETPNIPHTDAAEEELLDLSAVEVAEEQPVEEFVLLDQDAEAEHFHSATPTEHAPAHEPIMLDGTLPEEEQEEEFELLPDDALMDDASYAGNGEPAVASHADHQHGKAQAANGSDDDLMEFNAYLQHLKEGSAGHEHR